MIANGRCHLRRSPREGRGTTGYKSLSRASFTSLKQLEQHIDAYIKAYNDKAEPFVWAKKNPSTPLQRPPYQLSYDFGY
jgi:hypothetical protein